MKIKLNIYSILLIYLTMVSVIFFKVALPLACIGMYDHMMGEQGHLTLTGID